MPCVQLAQRVADAPHVVGRHDDARARLADERSGRAVGRDDGEDRPPGGEVLEDLSGQDALPAPARIGHEQEERLGVALEPQRFRARRVRDELEPVAEAELLGPLAVGGAEIACKSGHDIESGVVQRLQERTRVSLPEEAPGVGDPEAFRGPVLEPDEVVEVAAVRDRAHDPARAERANLLRDRLRHARDRVRSSGDEARQPLVRRLASARRRGVRAPVRVGDERIAEIRDPTDAGHTLQRRADEMNRAGRRCRHDGVDLLPAHDAESGRDGGQVPAHARVGKEQPARGHLSLHDRPLEPGGRSQLLCGLARARAEIARAVHPGLRGNAELRVAVHPLGVVGREHVRLDPERGKVLREFQRTLHPAASRWREVHRHDENPHRAKRKGQLSAKTQHRGQAEA
jgi:hypothetical protein